MTATKTADSQICLAAGKNSGRTRAGKVPKFPSPDPAQDKVVELADKMDSVNIEETTEQIQRLSDCQIIKHPLENAWTLFFKNGKSRTWEDNQKPVITVTTVEDFWALMHHIDEASELKDGCDYSFFKEGIFPDWEDVRNAPGGRWMITVDKRQRRECLDTYWREILMFLIGEQAGQHAHQVNGAVVTVRPRGDKLAIWLADASQPDSIIKVGSMIKEQLEIPPRKTIGFNVHSEEKAGTKTMKWSV